MPLNTGQTETRNEGAAKSNERITAEKQIDKSQAATI